MTETQLASLRLGSNMVYDESRKIDTNVIITIADGQNDKILEDITIENAPFAEHTQMLENYYETFELETFADKSFSEFLTDRNRLIIPDEFGKLREFIITEVFEERVNRSKRVWSIASYLDIAKSKIIKAFKSESWTATQHGNYALAGTEWKLGNVESTAIRTINFEENVNPFQYLKRIAREFELELDFRIEHDGNQITGRYVDLVQRLGDWHGREVEFGKDLESLERNEVTDHIVTALYGYGPEREDGTRIEVFVEDREALEKWSRNGQHLVGEHYITSIDEEMTEGRVRELTRAELEKRVKPTMKYVGNIVDLEKVYEHEILRFADTIRIKDTSYEPYLYLEARIHTQKRDIFNRRPKYVELGDFIEYSDVQNMMYRQPNNIVIQNLMVRVNEIEKTVEDLKDENERLKELVEELSR